MVSANKTVLIVLTFLICCISCSESQKNELDNDMTDNDMADSDNDILVSDDYAEDIPDIDTDNDLTDNDMVTEPELLSIRNDSISSDSSPNLFTQLNENTVVFSSFTENEGNELWRSDGTSEGTYLVKDIYPGRVSSNPVNLVNLGDFVYFLAGSDLNRILMFKTDGTPEGTEPVKDELGNPVDTDIIEDLIDPPSFSYTATDSKIFFIRKNSDGTKSLMMTDNNSDYAEDLGSFPDISYLVGAVSNKVLFWAKDASGTWKLWKNPGKKDGSTLVHDSDNQSEFAFLVDRYSVEGKIYFVISFTDDKSKDYSGNLFVTDGTTEGTELITETINLSNACSSSQRIFFNYERNVIYYMNKADNEIKQLNIGASKWIDSINAYDNETLLVTYTEDNGDDGLYKLGILNITTEEFTDFHEFESFEKLIVLNDTEPVVIKYKDQWYLIDGEKDPEKSWDDSIYYDDYLYKLDLKNLKKEKVDKVINYSWSNCRYYPENITVAAGKIWMSGNIYDSEGSSIGYEPVVSDGTKKGSHLIKDINRASEYMDEDFYPIFCDRHLYYNSAASYLYRRKLNANDLESELVSQLYHLKDRGFYYSGNTIFIPAYLTKDSKGEYQLISIDTDGMEIKLVKSGQASLITPVKHGFIFQYWDNETYKRSIFSSDGTESGTKVLKEGNPEYSSSYSFHRNFLSNTEEAVFFYLEGKEETLNYQILTTDGTIENTEMIFEGIRSALYTHHDSMLCKDKFLMSARPGSNSVSTLYYGAYISDGTADGTHEVFLCEKSENCEKIHVGCANGQPLLFIKEFIQNRVIVKTIGSDGKPDKTILTKTDADFPENIWKTNMSDLESYFFPLYTEQNGTELWKTDGTQTGTVMVKDISKGIESSNPEILAVHNGKVYFNASDGTSGYELWETDGTEAGTKIVTDIFSGTGSSTPNEMTVTDYGIVFSAIDEDGRNKLWFIRD